MAELIKSESEEFQSGFFEELALRAMPSFAGKACTLLTMSDDEAHRFGRTEIQFGKLAGTQYRDVPIEYLCWLADSALRLQSYLRSSVGRRRIDLGE